MVFLRALLLLTAILVIPKPIYSFPVSESEAPAANDDPGKSRCPGVTCVPAPPGTTCEAKYGVQDKCCPRWVCANGQTVFGSMGSQTTSNKNGGGFSFGFNQGMGFGGADPPNFNFPSNFGKMDEAEFNKNFGPRFPWENVAFPYGGFGFYNPFVNFPNPNPYFGNF